MFIKKVNFVLLAMYHFKCAVGGTFDLLHKGHRVLIEEAFKHGEKVVVGITREKEGAKPLKVRKKNLEKLLRARYPGRYEIVELDDDYGPAISDEELDAIAVSEETHSRALEINDIREEKGLKKLVIYKVPMVLAENGSPVSAERIKSGEIDREGHLQS